MQIYFVTFRCAQYTIQLHFITSSNDFNFLSIITLNSRQKNWKISLTFWYFTGLLLDNLTIWKLNYPNLSQNVLFQNRQIRPKFLSESGKSGSGRIWKFQIRCTPILHYVKCL